ncbi:hypothetical protein [Streptomonospora litoralis]|uniref:Uncharacterized protein n=1 Tax=Streptomonospora litoralis TaxID=2498135 RepID=A0A4P6Q812_9ACTN|nr:hypothetical protein [Streptomonospora litoralis]QBI56550.1 hypothetical protein EKD16_24025 [Streptomonospora litoralis]
MSEPLGHEPEETRDREFAPVLREDEEALSREEAAEQGRKVTGTGVATSVPAERDPQESADRDATETRSELEAPEVNEESEHLTDAHERRGGDRS